MLLSKLHFSDEYSNSSFPQWQGNNLSTEGSFENIHNYALCVVKDSEKLKRKYQNLKKIAQLKA
jgi:hypothetical protein